jgi:hypothetical protein
MRKKKTIKIMDRERELTFEIQEMPATKLESWIIRALIVLGPVLGKVDGEEVTITEAVGLLRTQGLNFAGMVDYEKIKPLLDDLLACCVRTDCGVPQVCTPQTVDGFISDFKTLFKLRQEALAINLSFFDQGQGSPLFSPEKTSSKGRVKAEASPI